MSAAIPWSRVFVITLAAALLLAGFHLLPRGSALSHMDFLADRETVLQFCDAQNSRPLAAAAGGAPVTMTLAPREPFDFGGGGEVLMELTTISHKPVGPDDLLPRHRPAVRLSIVGPAGTRFPPTEAAPGKKDGEWRFRFVPRGGKGPYRISASFTPAATGTEMSVASAFTVLR